MESLLQFDAWIPSSAKSIPDNPTLVLVVLFLPTMAPLSHQVSSVVIRHTGVEIHNCRNTWHICFSAISMLIERWEIHSAIGRSPWDLVYTLSYEFETWAHHCLSLILNLFSVDKKTWHECYFLAVATRPLIASPLMDTSDDSWLSCLPLHAMDSHILVTV